MKLLDERALVDMRESFNTIDISQQLVLSSSGLCKDETNN
jgi:hypothetical protein